MTHIVNRAPRLRIRFSQAEWLTAQQQLGALGWRCVAPSEHLYTQRGREAEVDRRVIEDSRRYALDMYDRGEKVAALSMLNGTLSWLEARRRRRVEHAHTEALEFNASYDAHAATVDAGFPPTQPELLRRRWFARR